jgi:hypothetical protein
MSAAATSERRILCPLATPPRAASSFGEPPDAIPFRSCASQSNTATTVSASARQLKREEAAYPCAYEADGCSWCSGVPRGAASMATSGKSGLSGPMGQPSLSKTSRGGAWADLEPKAVRIPADRFAVFRKMNEVTIDDAFELRRGEYLQGAMLQRGTETAVYVVTVPPPPHLGVLTPWPRIVSSSRGRAAGRAA